MISLTVLHLLLNVLYWAQRYGCETFPRPSGAHSLDTAESLPNPATTNSLHHPPTRGRRGTSGRCETGAKKTKQLTSQLLSAPPGLWPWGLWRRLTPPSCTMYFRFAHLHPFAIGCLKAVCNSVFFPEQVLIHGKCINSYSCSDLLCPLRRTSPA